MVPLRPLLRHRLALPVESGCIDSSMGRASPAQLPLGWGSNGAADLCFRVFPEIRNIPRLSILGNSSKNP
jgi:hypothetical protein